MREMRVFRSFKTGLAGVDLPAVSFDRLVGPVVALAEQNAIDLVPAVVASSHTCKETFRGIAAEGQTERRHECR